jgi:hypothetical protein
MPLLQTFGNATSRAWRKYGPNGSPAAYELISTQLVSSTTASVTFDVSALATTYKHLQVRQTMRNATGVGYNILESYLRFNGATTSYSRHDLTGDGSSISSGGSTTYTSLATGLITGNDSSSSIYGTAIIDILDAFSTTKNKTMRGLSGTLSPAGLLGPASMLTLRSGAWYSTSAITSVTLLPGYGGNPNGNIAAGSRISLYGLK